MESPLASVWPIVARAPPFWCPFNRARYSRPALGVIKFLRFLRSLDRQQAFIAKKREICQAFRTSSLSPSSSPRLCPRPSPLPIEFGRRHYSWHGSFRALGPTWLLRRISHSCLGGVASHPTCRPHSAASLPPVAPPPTSWPASRWLSGQVRRHCEPSGSPTLRTLK
jgi:hypothetical protein